MIEMLMVIALVALLSALAIPAFLDFRREGKIASVKNSLGNFRSAIKIQKARLTVRCGLTGNTSYPTAAQMTNNSILPVASLNGTPGDVVTDTCLSNIGTTLGPDEAMIMNGAFPVNPFVNAQYGGVYGTNFGTSFSGVERCDHLISSLVNTNCVTTSVSNTTPIGATVTCNPTQELPSWIYNEYDGEIWANTSENLLCSV